MRVVRPIGASTLSAPRCSAALTAVFGKIGVAEMSSDLATFYRTVVILMLLALVVALRQEWQRPDTLSPRGLAFLALSGLATGLSWLCYITGRCSSVRPRGWLRWTS